MFAAFPDESRGEMTAVPWVGLGNPPLLPRQVFLACEGRAGGILVDVQGGCNVCMMNICRLAKSVSRGVEDLDSDIMWGCWEGEHKSWRWLRFRRQMTFPQFVKLQR